MKPFSIVVAMDEKNGIGKNGDLAWRLPADLKHFKEITTKTNDPSKQNAVIMGRKTWDSLPGKFKPLPNRLNVVLTRMNPKVVLKTFGTTLHGILGVPFYKNLNTAIKEISLREDIEQIFVIGGGQVFDEAIKNLNCHKLYLTYIKGNFTCDTFFPTIPASFKIIKESPWAKEGELEYRFCQYKK